MDNNVFSGIFSCVLNDSDDDFRQKFTALELWYHDLNA